MAEPPESWAAFLVYMSIAPLFLLELFQWTSREELPQSWFYLFGVFLRKKKERNCTKQLPSLVADVKYIT